MLLRRFFISFAAHPLFTRGTPMSEKDIQDCLFDPVVLHLGSIARPACMIGRELLCYPPCHSRQFHCLTYPIMLTTPDSSVWTGNLEDLHIQPFPILASRAPHCDCNRARSSTAPLSQRISARLCLVQKPK